MNNDQFRRLLFDDQPKKNGSDIHESTPQSLGLKRSLPGIAPRTTHTSGTDFARQVRERHGALQPRKAFKSSAPKGSKLAKGYTDRAKARADAEDKVDDKAERIKALEEQAKLGQLDQETFESLRDQITGGNVGSTHLVKGLDRKLLEKIRRGEDVYGTDAKQNDGDVQVIDDELDELEDKEVQQVQKDKIEKKGNKATSVIGVKRTRDDIMAELKAQRKAAAEAQAAAAPKLDSRWRTVGEEKKSRIEIDHKGREVLITVDEDGVVKRRVRKAAAVPDTVDMPDAIKPVLGADAIIADLPESSAAPQHENDSEDDIFADAGIDYDPLGADEDDDDDDDDESSDDEDESIPKKNAVPDQQKAQARLQSDNDSRSENLPSLRRNYFNDKPGIADTQSQDRLKGLQGVLQKAARLGASLSGETPGSRGTEDSTNDMDEESKARLARRAKMLADSDRDMQDMDLGFGSSRYEDEEDGEGDGKMRLSEWKGGDDAWEEDGEGGGKKGEKRKRKPKKRKGDANNVADIMRVIEGRKSAASK